MTRPTSFYGDERTRFDAERSVFLAGIQAMLSTRINDNLKREEIEATISAIRQLAALHFGDKET